MRLKSIRPLRFLAYVVIVVLIVVALFPIYWVVRTSLLPRSAIFSNPGSLLPPTVTWTNYGRLFGLYDTVTAQKMGGTGLSFNFLKYLSNTLLVASCIMVFQVLFSAMAAFAFARLRFPLRNQIFGLYLAAMMVPGIVLIIPNFILMKELGWLNTYMGIMAPSLLLSPFTVFFLRQFFIGINRELEEAAYIDGASKRMVFFRIIIPLSVAPMGTISIITFINVWNDYLWPLLVGSADKVRLLTVALGIFRQQTPQTGADWGGLMAGAALAMAPILLLYIVTGKRVHQFHRIQRIPVMVGWKTSPLEKKEDEERGTDRMPKRGRTMAHKKGILVLGLIVALATMAAATAGADPVTIKYWLWDSNQLPMYQNAANLFMAKNPDIKIEITQLGWDDYWNGIATGMVAGTAPDVMTNNSSKSFVFEVNNQLVDIAPLIKRDNVDTSIYLNGVDKLWIRRMGSATASRRTGTRSRSCTTATSPRQRE